MRLVRSFASLAPDSLPPCVLTIGAFDGLHKGHQAIFDRARQIADEVGGSLITLTFEPTPAEFFAPVQPPARLTCFRERFELLAQMRVDELICPRFSDVNALTHDRFVDEILVAGLNVRHIVIGSDFRYGSGRKGDVGSLRDAGRKNGFEVTVVDPVYHDGQRISSTRIRQSLAIGDLEPARQMLGRDYSMSGRVVHGLALGRDFGFPTANVNLKRRQAPVDGIFAVQVDGVGVAPLDGVASIGSRPTVGGGKTLLEVFIFDFDSDLYGDYITVRFCQRLRSEEHFESVDALKVQMHDDARAARAALAKRIA
jgi:riboflavin kinase/FMN adenylyltransferase